MSVIVFLFLTVLSGVGDAYGFREASRIWESGHPSLGALFRSAVGFAIGIGFWWAALRFFPGSASSATIQTLTWFIVTIIGIALFSRDAFHWDVINWICVAVAGTAIAILVSR